MVFCSLLAVLLSIGYVASEEWPQERFLSISTLGSNETAENYYPNGESTIAVGDTMKWYMNVYNHMGQTEYLSIRMKLINSSQPTPDESSYLQDQQVPIFRLDRVVEDNSRWIEPLTWSIAGMNQDIDQISIKSLSVNGVNVDNLNTTTVRGKEFRIILELWRYDTEAQNFVFSQLPSAKQSETKQMNNWNQIWFRLRELEQGIFLQQLVIDAMRKYNCKTVRDLVTRLQIIDHSLTVEDICAIVKALEKEKKIVLAHPQIQYSFFGYLTKSIASLPFWLAIAVVAMTLVVAYIPYQIVEQQWSAFRVVVGGAFMLFIPGYALTKLIFPRRQLKYTELIAFSIGLSLAFSSLVGLILNHISWKLSLDLTAMTLSLLTLLLLVLSEYRKFTYRLGDSMKIG